MFIIGIYVKIVFKNRGSQSNFWVLEVKRSKISQKLNKIDCFCLHSWFHLKLIWTINIWLNFVFGSFFEQDHLLNLFILGVYVKGWPKCARISIQKLMQPNIWSMNFFQTFTVRRPFRRKDFKWKKIGGTGLLSERTEVLYAELNEREEAATASYSVTGDSLQYIYSLTVTKDYRNIQSRGLVHEFFFTNVF